MGVFNAETNYEVTSASYVANEVTTAWLGTAGSQIFFMQLGFLCYEVGFVKSFWAPSIILKNIEDTFVGILTYLAFTHSLAASTPSLGGIISVPKNMFLIGIDSSAHDEVFIAAVFATTCATIISGGVLERMKNKAYIFWCFLVILVNYSFVAHWIWHPQGWLAKLGYVDGAGSVVVHSTGGIAALIAMWRLGPRRGSVDKNGNLLPIEPAQRPIINAIGAFILWYGWFAFNVSSPVAANLGIGAAVGTTGLVTCIAPTCASCSALLMMYMGFADLSYDNLLGALLAGLVSITGGCYTVDVWASVIIGLFASPVFFMFQHVVRYKLMLDDPLQIVPVHLCCGLYACIIEGVFANNVMGHPGLIYGGFSHFGIQLLGTFVVTIFNVIICCLLWSVVMEKCFFRNTEIRVSILDTYLGTKMFELNNSLALEEVLNCRTNLAKQMLFNFHEYTIERFNNEQFDFLVAITVFHDLMQFEKKNSIKIANAIIHIAETYVGTDSEMCINLSGTQRAQIMKIVAQLKYEMQQQKFHKKMKEKENENNAENENDRNSQNIPRLTNRSSILKLDVVNEKIFDNAFTEVFKIVLPVFSKFLQDFDKKKDTVQYSIKLPFHLQDDWILKWEESPQKETNFIKSLSEAAGLNDMKEDDMIQIVDIKNAEKNSTTNKMSEDLVNPSTYTPPHKNNSSPAFILHTPFETGTNSLIKADEQKHESNDDADSSVPNENKNIKKYHDSVTIIVQ